MKLNEKIEKLRTDNGLSQQELADKVFVSRQAVQKWEKGKSQPSIDVLKSLAKLFDVTVDFLISDDEPEKEPEPETPSTVKTEESGGKTPENGGKTKKHTGVKITLGILIPALVIGGGALTIKLVKDAKQKAYDETFGTSAFNDDFDIRTQIIPTVNNVAVQVIPKHDVKEVKYKVYISAGLLSEYQDSKTYDSLSEGQAITFEYPYSEMSSSLRSGTPERVLVSMNAKKQNKYKKNEESKNDYAGISGHATYDTSKSINQITPYITSNFDGLIFGGKELKIVYKHNNSKLIVSAASFLMDGPRYLRKGDSVQIKGKFNTEINGGPGSGIIDYQFDHIESGKIFYGPKSGNGSINLGRHEELITSKRVENIGGGEYKLYFDTMVDINELTDISIFVMESRTSSVVVAHQKLGDFKNLNLKAYNETYIVAKLNSDTADFSMSVYPFKFIGYAKTPFDMQYSCKISYDDIMDGNETNYRAQFALPGYPLQMPTTTTYSGKSVRGYYEDEGLTKLADFNSAVTEEYTYLYGKVK